MTISESVILTFTRKRTRLNEVWKAGLQGKAGIEEFRRTLKEWYLLHLQGIEIYCKEQGRQGK